MKIAIAEKLLRLQTAKCKSQVCSKLRKHLRQETCGSFFLRSFPWSATYIIFFWGPKWGISSGGNTIRGNKTESLWEGNLPLRGSLRGPLKISENLRKISENLCKPLKTSKKLWKPPSQRPSHDASGVVEQRLARKGPNHFYAKTCHHCLGLALHHLPNLLAIRAEC